MQVAKHRVTGTLRVVANIFMMCFCRIKMEMDVFNVYITKF